MSLPTIVFLAPAGLCAISWLGVGALLPSRLLPDDRLLRILTRTGAGATAFGLVSYSLGRAHLYQRSMLLGLTAAFALVALPYLRRVARLRPRLDSRAERWVAGLIAVALALDLVAASAPPTSADALKYHLALPDLWLHAGSISDPFWSWPSFNPFGIEMLYGQALALAGGPSASALGAILAALCAAAIYGLGRELGRSRAAGLAGAALFVLQGVFTWEATSDFVELGLCFFLALALWYAVRFARAGRGADLVWAGAFAGSTAGTKYVGLQAWLLIVPLLALGVRRRHMAAVAGACGAAFAAGGLWYAKNLVVAGNPVYPFGGGRWWTPMSQHEVDQIGKLYGVGGSAVRLVLLPVDLLTHGGRFDRGQYVGTAIFAAAVLSLALARRRELLVLYGSVALYAVAWWYSSPQARFLLPALGVLAAGGGAGVVALGRRGRLSRWLLSAALLIVVAAWIIPTGALVRHSLRVALGSMSRDAYIEMETGTYSALRAAGAQSQGALALGTYPFLYYVPGPSLALGKPEFAADVPATIFRARLRQEGVEYILDTPKSVASYPQLRGCLVQVARYPARLVTSRSRGTSVPLDLRLFVLRPRCRQPA